MVRSSAAGAVDPKNPVQPNDARRRAMELAIKSNDTICELNDAELDAVNGGGIFMTGLGVVALTVAILYVQQVAANQK
jgi:hypothetical protein